MITTRSTVSSARFAVGAAAMACRVLVAVAAALTIGSCQRAPATQSARDFEAQWHELMTQRNYTSAQKLIDQREKQLPGDPEVAIARANLYFRQATGPAGRFAPGGKPSATTDAAGLDTLQARHALDTLRDGIARHPERLDMRLGLAFLCQQLGLRLAEVQIFSETVAYALEHPGGLRWSYGDPLPLPADQFVPQSLHDYVRFYADRGGPGDEQSMMAIGQIVMQAYPHSAYVPNDLAYYYGQRRDWKTSLEYLKVAERADSTDALVLYNLGWTHEQLKHHDPALHYYRRALTTSVAGNQRDLAESARQRLVALGSTP